jgi:hypothetical protein
MTVGGGTYFHFLFLEVTLVCIQVVVVSEDLGSAGALRAISKRLTANDILVMFVLSYHGNIDQMLHDSNTLSCV